MFRPGLSLGEGDFPVHLLLVALQQRDVVSDDPKHGRFQMAIRGKLKCAVRFGEAVREEIALRKSVVRKRIVGTLRDLLLERVNRSLPSAGPVSGKASQEAQRCRLPITARIGLKPQFESLVRLFQISRHLPVVGKVDKEFFSIADAITQLPGVGRALG